MALTKLKAFADNKFIVANLMIHLPAFDRAENIVGKGENADNQHFSPFPTFSKASYTGSLPVCPLKFLTGGGGGGGLHLLVGKVGGTKNEMEVQKF